MGPKTQQVVQNDYILPCDNIGSASRKSSGNVVEKPVKKNKFLRIFSTVYYNSTPLTFNDWPCDAIKINIQFQFGGNDSDEDNLKAFDLYRSKKIVTQSLMDIALFTANASQLKVILSLTHNWHVVNIISLTLLVISIILQVSVQLTWLSVFFSRINVRSIETL